MSNPHTENYRLPAGVKPLHYDLVIKTDLEKLKFQGIVTIDLDIRNDTNSFTFNTAKTDVTSVSVTCPDEGTKQIDLHNLTFNKRAEQASLTLPTTLKSGSEVVLSIHFERLLTDELKGYYYSKYDNNGQKLHYAVTQFEATAARHAFPCWDEPALKATFKITMISRDNTVNLSNMPVVSETKVTSPPAPHFFGDNDSDGWKITTFERTPIMSTYIVALANGDFKYKEGSYISPLSGRIRPLRIYATEDCIHQTQVFLQPRSVFAGLTGDKFCLDVKAKALIQYEQAFDIEFALPKLDTLVVHDFDAGAMENWGLITGRTIALLVDPERTDLATKRQIAAGQSHEVAHMWFGNIATMKWWDNLWLNEGFATLMGEVVILNKLFPDWKVYSSFYNSHTESALSLDARLSSHPIQVDVPNAEDIGQIFDSLSYSKAASVLRMLSVYTGEEKFLQGVSIYLKDHLYSNTVAEDLWAGIQQATGLDIPGLMDNWISKTGYPVLTVKETDCGIYIRQDRFLITGEAEEKDNETIWHVPLRIQTINSKGEVSVEEQALLTTRETTYKLDINSLYKLNAGGTGFYRVLYPPEHLAKLGQEAVRSGSTLKTEDRLSLLNDAMNLAISGYSNTSSVLSFIDNLKESETEYLVWKGIASQVGSAIQSRSDKADEDSLRDFLRTMLVPLVRKMGYEYPPGEHPDTAQLRTIVIETAVDSGLIEAVQKLQGWFLIYLATGSNSHIPPDLISATFKVATKHGGRREWEEMKKEFINPSDPSAQLPAAYAICNTRDPVLIEETFDIILNHVPNHASPMILYFFFGVASNDKIGKNVLSFFKTNYDEIVKKMDGTFQLSYILSAISGALKGFQDAQELEDFFKGRDTSKINQSLSQTLDLIRARAAWSERSHDDVKNWLKEWRKNNLIEEGLIV